MSTLSWYWHRLRAMSAAEMMLHARKRTRQWSDARSARDWNKIRLEPTGRFPMLPPAAEAPSALIEALKRDVLEILSGRWQAFGHLPIQVDDPPRWHKDYLAIVDLPTNTSAFQLDHRKLPNGADIKLVWELSRWNQLVRLAQAAYVLNDRRAAEKCIDWLEDWVKHNPPFQGWNWTSALESGIRLIQFTWMDALLRVNAQDWGIQERLEALWYKVLPAHVWFTWRYKSFGSSANNHLLGEIVGLLVATSRWPALAKWGASLQQLHGMWEREVTLQFAEDGGNREQALSYQLFSFEFAWQARLATKSANREISAYVESRLAAAAGFFCRVQVDADQWDYGDSDNACVTPLFLSDPTRVAEWRHWLAKLESDTLSYWIGGPPVGDPPRDESSPVHTQRIGSWWISPQTGIAIAKAGLWHLRWDVSPLGYLSTAAHGHLDALHLSAWYRGVAFIVDPGTGAYYGDKKIRAWLASREAHNGPCVTGGGFPERLGPFLWSAHHAVPKLEADSTAHLDLPGAQLRRRITSTTDLRGWIVEDSAIANDGSGQEFSVRWQFAPDTSIRRISDRRFILNRRGVAITLEASGDWAEVLLVEHPDVAANPSEGLVSPAFRKVEWAPFLKLIARPKPGQSCVFRTTFVASAAS